MYHRHLVPLHQTYRCRGKMNSRFTSKLFTSLCIFLSTLLLIIYPSQEASDDLANDLVNNLINSSGGGLNGDDPLF
jgi:hypothetical protein